MKKTTHPRCKVCRHEERWRIELLRASGASLEALASKFGLDKHSIWRHWTRHVSDEMKAGYLAGPVHLQELASKAADTGTSVLDNLHAIRVVLMSHMASMTEAGDGRGAAYVANVLTGTLEKIARISGELGALATNLTINNHTSVAILENPHWLKVQSVLLRSLAGHPDARASVVSALRALEADTPMNPAGKVIEHAAA